jgi:hypothetical protein
MGSAIRRPSVNLDGKLTPNSAWNYQFLWKEREKSLWVTVPAIGSSSVCYSWPSPHYRSHSPLLAGWVDSDAAIEVAEDSRKRFHTSGVKLLNVLADLEPTTKWTPLRGSNAQPQARWKLHYFPNHLVANPEPRLLVLVDAHTGKCIGVDKQ